MGHTTVRITEGARNALRRLAEFEGRSMQEILEQAIENYRRQKFLDQVNAGYAALRQDPQAWRSYQEDMDLWDNTLLDGLPVEPPFEATPQAPPKPRRRSHHERAG